MNRGVLEAAAKTRGLAGRAPAFVDGRLMLALLGALALTTASLVAAEGAGSAYVAGAFVAFMALLVALGRWLTRAVGINNAAVAALAREAWAEATPSFARLVTGNFPRGYAALGLHNLAYTSLQQGHLDDAVALSAAAVELGRGLRGRSRGAYALFASMHALTRAAGGDPAGAQALLDMTTGEEASAQVEANRALSTMYVAFKQGRHADVIATARASRALLFDALTGFQAVLAEALEVLAAQRVAGAYRAGVERPLGLPVGRGQFELLATLLPEAAPLLAVED